jgi:hypothetical protein
MIGWSELPAAEADGSSLFGHGGIRGFKKHNLVELVGIAAHPYVDTT